MKLRHLLLLLALPLFSVAQQANYSTKNKKAINYYEAGKQLILQRKFEDAEHNFNLALEKDQNFVEVYIALAGIHRLQRDDPKTKHDLLTAFSINPTIPEAMYEYYVLGALFLKEGDYTNALFYLNKFFSFNPPDRRVVIAAEKMKKNCEFAEAALKNPVQFTPTLLDSPLNMFKMQYFPSMTADNQFMIFTVRNATQMLDEENLYCSSLDEGAWNIPKQLSDRVNTKENEGASSISGDGKTLVYTYCTPRNGCDLFISKRVRNEWMQPASLGNKINTSGWESHPSLSADGRTLYFASDRPGGQGKEDIWVTTLDSSNNWTRPRNLGDKINTVESDMTPFIHANGSTLYFSSKGWTGMGGMDLFFSEKKEESGWTEPKNLGYPVNTFADESGMFVSSDFSKGYFSKDFKEPDGSYASKIYSFSLSEALKGSVSCVYLKGKVLDAQTRKPIKARVELSNVEKDSLEQTVISDPYSGDYLLVLPIGQNYGLFASAEGYLYKSLNFNTEKDKLASEDKFEILLEPLRKNSSTILSNLFFETGKYALDKNSKTELNKLASLIRQNLIKVEISGHTDNVGTTKDNETLSTKRAESVCNYLIDLGVNKQLLTAKGYAASRPIGDNSTEAGRQSNRRIEIKILE